MESRSWESASTPYFYGGYSSESRDDGESRSIPYRPSYTSESRVSSESRSVPFCFSSSSESSESRDLGESRSTPIKVTSSKKAKTILPPDDIASSLSSIDALIEKLDVPVKSKSTRMKKVVTERSKKIAELRKLREEVLARVEEDEEIKTIESGNEEIDAFIKSLRNKLK